MDILNTVSLESNSQIKINFDGGNLSSDAGLLPFKEFLFKIEKPYGQMVHMYTFIVTTMEMEPYPVLRFYCDRGKMENYIKEGVLRDTVQHP